MSVEKPLISVIIPVYNGEETVARAIDSIVRQTYSNLEIIVVNDASTDKTKEIVEGLMEKDNRIKLISAENDPERFDKTLNRNVNAGYSARNTALKMARGEYITFQDSDDTCLLNRIEIQYKLLVKYNAIYVTTDWIRFDKKYFNKKLDIAVLEQNIEMVGPEALYKMSQKTKGIVAKISEKLNQLIPFHIKRIRIINKLFWGSLESYPGIPGIPLFKRDIIDKVYFRKLSERVWPSFMGRGADRDFSFQVAETFKNSYVFFLPLYLWQVENQNPRFTESIDQFII